MNILVASVSLQTHERHKTRNDKKNKHTREQRKIKRKGVFIGNQEKAIMCPEFIMVLLYGIIVVLFFFIGTLPFEKKNLLSFQGSLKNAILKI